MLFGPSCKKWFDDIRSGHVDDETKKIKDDDDNEFDAEVMNTNKSSSVCNLVLRQLITGSVLHVIIIFQFTYIHLDII